MIVLMDGYMVVKLEGNRKVIQETRNMVLAILKPRPVFVHNSNSFQCDCTPPTTSEVRIERMLEATCKEVRVKLGSTRSDEELEGLCILAAG